MIEKILVYFRDGKEVCKGIWGFKEVCVCFLFLIYFFLWFYDDKGFVI